MIMAFDPLTAILNIGGKVLDKVLPDKEAQDKAKLALAKLNMDGELKEVEISMSAIIAEAKSSDPWTSRARPSFLYVMYILILFSLPMGVISAFKPAIALNIANGMKAYLGAIPTGLWTTFGIGYGGYTVARSAWDKRK